MRPSDGARLARYVRSVRRLSRADVSRRTLLDGLRHRLDRRETALLEILAEAVFARPTSPYLPLFRHAGVEFGDVRTLVAADGVERALQQLYDAGVRVSTSEIRGRTTIVRPGLELEVSHTDFDNPLLADGYRAQSGGSTGAPRKSVLDVDSLVEDAAYHRLWIDAFELEGRPLALWRSVPPGRAGIRTALRCALLGPPLEAWFTPNDPGRRGASLQDWLALNAGRAAARSGGLRIPRPLHVPFGQVEVVARWLADRVAEGRPPILDTPSGSGARAIAAVMELGLDVSGTFLRVGGEPFTPAKARVIASAGATAFAHYSMSEVSRVAIACARPSSTDDVHFLADKLAALPPTGAGTSSPVILTSLSRTTSKLLINADTGDTAVFDDRPCGCPVGAAGLPLRLHTIRAPEKLTGEGVAFFASDVLELVERILPGRFGGTPTDYQIAEFEREGVTRVAVVISPRVGPVDDEEAIRLVLEMLSRGAAHRRMMTSLWTDAGALEVERREPHVTEAGKLPALHARR